MNVHVFLQRKAFVVGHSRRSAGGSTVSGRTVVCLQNTAKYFSCCWEDISDSSVLNTARSPGSRCESVSSLVVLCGHMNVHGSTVSGSTVVCIQNTAKYSCCCWEDISDSSVLNTLHASMYASYFCRNAPVTTVTLAMYYCCTPCCTAAMSQLEEKVKELEFPLVEDADGEEYGEGTWSNAVAMVKALAGDGFTLIRRNKNRVRLGTFFAA